MHRLYRWFAWPGVIATVLLATGVITLAFRAGDILSLVAAATASFGGVTTTLYISPYASKPVQIGDSMTIDINMNSRVAINAIGATISFPTDLIEVVAFSKEKSFLDLWTEETAIREDIGEIHFSGGTIRSGGMTGTGTVLTLTIRSKNPGTATIAFKDSEIFPNDGTGRAVSNETRELTFDIVDRVTKSNATPQTSSVTVAGNALTNLPQPRTPDVNTDGVVNLVDVSIMIMRLVMPYDYHFDLNNDGAVNVADVSTVLTIAR